MANLPIYEIVLFIDIVNLQSFTRVACKHHITPAAVSKRISALEKYLGIRLFNRSTRKIALTESGEVLYRHCSNIHQDLESAKAAVLDLHNTPQGTLTISSPTNFSNLVLASLVAEFSQEYPKIFINVMLTDARKIPEIGSFDLAIRSGQLCDSSLLAKKLATIRFIFCASPQYIRKYGMPQTPEELVRHKTIDYNYREEGLVWSFYKDNHHQTQKITPIISSNNALFIKFVAVHHGGITCLPDFMIEKEIKAGRLVICFPDYTTLSQPIWVIHPYVDRYFPQKVQLFMDFIFERMKTFSV